MIKRSNSVEELSNDQLRCHMYRHDFGEPEIFLETYTRKHPTGNSQGWIMVHECKSCGVRRHDYVEPETYNLWDRRYEYHRADGYLLSFVANMQDFRAEMIRRRRMRAVESA